MREDYFQEIEAVSLFCPTCQRPVQVVKRLFLVLPGGDKYEYRCSACGRPLGSKTDKADRPQF